MDGLEFIKDSFGKMNGLLTFITITLIILSFLAIKFKDTISKVLTKKKDKRVVKDLLYHSMFLTCDKVLKKIDAIDFTTFDDYDEVKSKLLRKLIKLKIDTVSNRFKELLVKDELQDMNRTELKFLVSKTLTDLVHEYNNEALKVMTSEMGITAKDAEFLINRYEDFRQYIVDAFVDELDIIVTDENYKNNFDRLNTILYAVSISLSIIPRDVVATFNGVNGRFKKYKRVDYE